jgi:8-oxo-dGTP pyrophosphatase MutT (NUDIX family)
MKEICAGILPIHIPSKRILIALRSSSNLWATFGGHFENFDKIVRNAAIREFFEETKFNKKYNISKEPFYIYEDNFIKYYTFLGFFNNMFEPIIDSEHSDYQWVKINELPKNLLPGFRKMFIDKSEELNNLSNIDH